MFTNSRFMRSATPLGLLLFAAAIVISATPARGAERVTTGARAAHGGGGERLTSDVATSEEVTVALREPDVARAGKRNRFAVTVENAAGHPVSDADVRLTLYKPGISRPKGFLEYPFQTTVRLQQGERSGTYEGVGAIPTPGAWQVTIAVKQRGDQVARQTTNVWARW